MVVLLEDRKEISQKGRIHLEKEIAAYIQLLRDYKITFSDLTNSCPKNANHRQEAIKVARLISENNQLATYVKVKKKLPIKEIQKFVSCCHKTISKYRRYVLALTLIYVGDFTNIKDYINQC
ncbi:hypothetical protein [Litchfieldia alkalitelluris]|uniref:hypothetical protein n=1 Tax=Litchfieldia alkalitelluris TaxID=304268 RepID=UPI000997B26B|nr:hypothetical protein [Litchfieldia alkalitelluris]